MKKDGAIVVNDHRIDPMPVVTGAAQYPENIIENLAKEHSVYSVNAMDEALKLGNSRVFNIIVLGVAAKHMDFSKEAWLNVIEKTVPPKTVEINKKAFLLGFESFITHFVAFLPGIITGLLFISREQKRKPLYQQILLKV